MPASIPTLDADDDPPGREAAPAARGPETDLAEADVTLNGKSWKLTEALIGTLAGDRRHGTKADRVL